MRHFVRTTWILAAVLGIGVLVSSCGDDDEGGVTEVDPTQVRATVRVDGAAESGVVVGLFATGGTTALQESTTGANGQVTFEVDPGTYDVEVEIPSGLELEEGETARVSATVEEGETTSVSFDLVAPVGQSVVHVSVGENGLNFSPENAPITVGTTVVWTNAATMFHTITPDGHSEWSAGSVSQEGDTFSHTFETVGEFPYYCEPHRGQGMTGTITVEQ